MDDDITTLVIVPTISSTLHALSFYLTLVKKKLFKKALSFHLQQIESMTRRQRSRWYS